MFLAQIGECNSSVRLFQKEIREVQNLFLKICVFFLKNYLTRSEAKRTLAESGQEYLTSGKEHIQPCKTR